MDGMGVNLYEHHDTGLHAYWIGHSSPAIERAVYLWRINQLMAQIHQRILETIEGEGA